LSSPFGGDPVGSGDPNVWRQYLTAAISTPSFCSSIERSLYACAAFCSIDIPAA
jgi:hypothetical protein